MQITVDWVLRLDPCHKYQDRTYLTKLANYRTEISHRELAQLSVVPANDRCWILFRLLVSTVTSDQSFITDQWPILDSCLHEVLVIYYNMLRKHNGIVWDDQVCDCLNKRDRYALRSPTILCLNRHHVSEATDYRVRTALDTLSAPDYFFRTAFFDYAARAFSGSSLGWFRRYCLDALVKAFDQLDQEREQS